MGRENVMASGSGPVTGRITRARAAVLNATGKMPSRDQNLKPVLRRSSAKAASSSKENNIKAGDNMHSQRKRKAVLQEITNFPCKILYRDCLNATKTLAKNSKQNRKAPLKIPKVLTSASTEILKPQAVYLDKIINETVKEPLRSKMIPQAVKKEVDVYRTDHDLAGENSHMASEQQGCLKASGNLKGKVLSNQDVIDIDSDTRNPQLCGTYAREIYSNLRSTELSRRPFGNFMETIQRDITQNMRAILIDWLVEVSEEYKLVPDTLYVTVHLIDWYLSQKFVERRKLQLLGISCMLIASKYEEICAPRVEEFCLITDNTYTKEEVLTMEGQLLNYFGFRIYGPTTKTFLRRFLRAAQATYKRPSLELEYLADYLAELTLIEYSFLNFLPSLIAAAAVFLARWTLDHSCHPWNPTLEYYTLYKASDLKSAVTALQDLQCNAKGCPLTAIRSKYRQEKYKSVSCLSSTKVLKTLF